MSYNNTAMKKAVSTIVFAIAIITCAFALTGCVEGVVSDADLYGSYFNADNARCIILAEDNKAFVEMNTDEGVIRKEYFAKYDLIGNKIELCADNNYWGDVVYTINIKSADEIELIYQYTDGDGNLSEPAPIPFVRDSSYDKSAE
ncbi:MAG: hypothetical protein IJX05_00545 [Clostridia bacterium]|nr:hypothetical protein [Clostridia bacterium]